ALGEVTAGDVLRIVAKEIAVALLLALAMGGMAFGFALALTSLNLRVALAVATALVTVVVTADLVGAMLPLAASLVGADPAAMSAPLITTVADVSGVFMYFVIAQLFLRG
ncbi:MAG: magnesium transporter, partial [Thermoprotei archaeon]